MVVLSRFFCDVLLAQLAFEHLASGVTRQHIDKVNRLRHFEFGQIGFAVVDDGFRRDGLALFDQELLPFELRCYMGRPAVQKKELLEGGLPEE